MKDHYPSTTYYEVGVLNFYQQLLFVFHLYCHRSMNDVHQVRNIGKIWDGHINRAHNLVS